MGSPLGVASEVKVGELSSRGGAGAILGAQEISRSAITRNRGDLTSLVYGGEVSASSFRWSWDLHLLCRSIEMPARGHGARACANSTFDVEHHGPVHESVEDRSCHHGVAEDLVT